MILIHLVFYPFCFLCFSSFVGTPFFYPLCTPHIVAILGILMVILMYHLAVPSRRKLAGFPVQPLFTPHVFVHARAGPQ